MLTAYYLFVSDERCVSIYNSMKLPTLIQNATDSDIRRTILKHVAHAPLIGFGAISETYIGAIAEQRPVAIPEITRPAYRQSKFVNSTSPYIKKGLWKIGELTQISNQLQCTPDEKEGSASDHGNPSTKLVRSRISKQ